MADEITPIRKAELLIEVGGMVDECRATLAIHGEDLQPDDVSGVLGCSPSHSHRKGDRKGPTSPPFRSGAWLLTVESHSPSGPEEAISSLLARFPETPDFWQPIVSRYAVSIRLGIHSSGWNRGFALSSGLLAKIARTAVAMDFNLYLYGDEGDGGV